MRTVPFSLLFVAACSVAPERAIEEAQVEPPPEVAISSSGVTAPVVITPVIFVPRDQAFPTAQAAIIDGAVNDLQVWYRTRLGNGSLRFEGRRTVNGALTAAEYIQNNTVWNNAPAEIQAQLGFSPWSSGHVVLLMGVGLQGWAGGAGTGTSGFAVLGLESLINTPACTPNWWCTPAFWLGTAIHELGHALTLPHSAAPSIMDFHGDVLEKQLLNTAAWPEKNTLRNHGAFQLTLGAGQADWSACTSDQQCSTMRCGCNAGTSRVCLPNDDYPEHCTFTNWSSCNEDTECTSGRCGCNGGTSRVCLPNATYPKACTFSSWSACVRDSDCASNSCGCNGGTSRVCLPNATYPKTCTLAAYTPCQRDTDCASSRCGSNGSTLRVCLPSIIYPKHGNFVNWSSCISDSDCATEWCGCNGGTQRVCLPSTAYPKFGTMPNWDECLGDADCASGRCGCNNGMVRVCLPSSAYPRTCVFPNWSECAGDTDCASQWCGCNNGPVRVCLPSSAYPKACSL